MTRRCLKQIFNQTYSGAMTVFVVDDGSTDDTRMMLSAEYPQVKVIEGDGNLWWTGAVAKALKEIRGSFEQDDCFLLINNDTLLSAETIEVLVRDCERLGRPAISPSAICESESVSTGWGPGTPGILNDFDRQYQEFSGSGGVLQVQALFGRCTLFPVEILDLAENFDARTFPHYHGDTDFCLRAGKRGFEFFVTGATFVRVIENAKTTGSHYSFRQGPQPLPRVVSNMFSERSIDNLAANFRFYWRHNRRYITSKMVWTIWSSVRQWSPLYRMLGLTPLDYSIERKSIFSRWPRIERWYMRIRRGAYYVARVWYYTLRPGKSVDRIKRMLSKA